MYLLSLGVLTTTYPDMV